MARQGHLRGPFGLVSSSGAAFRLDPPVKFVVDWRDRSRTSWEKLMADTAQRTTRDVTSEVTAWLEENWDPDLTVAEWWDRLGTSGWAAPTWPEEWYGRGLSREEGVRVQQAIGEFPALGAPGGLGLLLAGPTIVTHGTDEQREHYLRDIVTGQKAWCQL